MKVEGAALPEVGDLCVLSIISFLSHPMSQKANKQTKNTSTEHRQCVRHLPGNQGDGDGQARRIGYLSSWSSDLGLEGRSTSGIPSKLSSWTQVLGSQGVTGVLGMPGVR